MKEIFRMEIQIINGKMWYPDPDLAGILQLLPETGLVKRFLKCPVCHLPILDYGGTCATDDACIVWDCFNNLGYCHQGCAYGRGLPK